MNKDFELPEEVLNSIKKSKKLGYRLYKSLLLNYGKRGEKAFFYLREKRVKKYRDFFIVVGEEEYLVEENYCSCKDFQINLKARKPCGHIIAVKVAEKLNLYDFIDLYYIDFIKKKKKIRN
jgi:predicted nucleic acid-binding Zn finger protein